MKKIIISILILLIFPIVSYAFDGELYFGKFLNSSLRARPDNGDYAQYVSGIKIGHQIKFIRPYVQIETLIDEIANEGQAGLFHPSSVIYSFGITANLKWDTYVDLSHMCWHPIDQNGFVEEYNLLKIGIKFGGSK